MLDHVECSVIKLAIENPALGPLRALQELLQWGIIVSSGGVRSIWLRHELETMKKRQKKRYLLLNHLTRAD